MQSILRFRPYSAKFGRCRTCESGRAGPLGMRHGNFCPTVKLIVTIAFAAFSAAHLCAQVPQNLSGTITDARGEAIQGAIVRCGARAAVTDGRGEFVLPNPSCGRVTVDAEGFESGAAPFAQTVSIVLRPSPVSASVTITGGSTPLTSSPASVAVVERRSLDTSGAVTLDDRLRQVPGFSLFRRSGSRTANPTTQGVSLRGVGASGASRAVVLKDGVALNDPFGSWVFWGRVPSESIGEVQIMRGPASDLYGTAAVGGVVAVRTRDVGEGPAASLDLGYGSEESPFASGFASGKWRRWGGSLAAEFFRTNGFVPVARAFRGTVDTAAAVRRSVVVPLVETRLGHDSRVFISGEFYRELRPNGTLLQRNDTRMNTFLAGADLPLAGFGALTLRAFGGTEKYHQSFSSIAADRRSESLTRLQAVPSQSVGGSVRWTFVHGRGTWFAGAENRRIRGRSDETGFLNDLPNVGTSAGGREGSSAIYAGSLVRLGDRFLVSGGVRYDRWSETDGFSASRSVATNILTVTDFADRRQSAVSPRGSILFRVSDHVSAAATVASGFRQPTLNELYRSFRVGNVLTLANEQLRAEKAVNGEAAVVVNALGERLYLRAGPFCTRVSETVSNVTLSVTPGLITRKRQNLGTTRSCGLEADTTLRLTRAFELSGGYLHVAAKVIEMPPGTTLAGRRLPQVPRDQATLRATFYRGSLGTFSLQLRGSGAQFDDDQNLLPLRGFISADVFASRQFTRNISLYIAGENIFDSKIEAGRTPVLTLAQPRTVRVGLRLRTGGQ